MWGIFGEDHGRGLIGCVGSKEHLDIVVNQARFYGIEHPNFKEIIARRMEEIESYQQLQQFYKKNEILQSPRKPIQVDDLNSLGLTLDEQEHTLRIPEVDSNGATVWRAKSVTMRQVVMDVIDQINACMKKNLDDDSIKGKRQVVLNINNGILCPYSRLGSSKCFSLNIDDEEENQLWLRRIINALVEKGHLFKFINKNGHGYYIQA